MANDGTGTGWDTADPADAGYASDGAKQIRDLRKAVGIRVDKEHSQCSTSSAGGEHKAGSARLWRVVSAAFLPDMRPDGVTALDTDDEGRLCLTEDTKYLYTWTGAAWELVAAAVASQVAESYIMLTQSATGAFNTGAWLKRNFANEIFDAAGLCYMIPGGGGQFQLLAGTYRCHIKVAGYMVGKHMARLQNITDGTTPLWGTSEYNATDQGWSTIVGRMIIAAPKTFEIQHYCGTTKATNGQGVSPSTEIPGVTQVCGIAEFWKEVA